MDDNEIHNLVKQDIREAVKPLWDADKERRDEMKEIRDGLATLNTGFARMEGSHAKMISLFKKNGNGKPKEGKPFDFVKMLKWAVVIAAFAGTLIGTILATIQGASLL